MFPGSRKTEERHVLEPERRRARPPGGPLGRRSAGRRRGRAGAVRGAEGGPVRPEVRDVGVELRRQPRLRQPARAGRVTVPRWLILLIAVLVVLAIVILWAGHVRVGVH